METGTVKFFDSRDNKRFGFAISVGGEEIFFHFNDGENIMVGKSKPEFSGGRLKSEPKKGDHIVFERGSGYKGLKAAPWGFFADYERAKKEIEARPAPATYRVLKQTTVYGNSPGNQEVLWEGSDISALCIKYPRPSDYRLDDLRPSFSCSDFEQTIWFERQTEKGWERTGDPRPTTGYGGYGRGRWIVSR